ncbi:MAG: hypothetical protein JWP01_2596 [Myxococcales bacterium]|nr:hypothetical protein [Myxococcales bacterium]
MTDIKTPTWADVRRIADELKAKIHHAGDEARERWAKLQPSLHEAEAEIKKGGAVVASKLVEIAGGLKEIGKDVAHKLDKLTHDKGAPDKGPSEPTPGS